MHKTKEVYFLNIFYLLWINKRVFFSKHVEGLTEAIPRVLLSVGSNTMEVSIISVFHSTQIVRNIKPLVLSAYKNENITFQRIKMIAMNL